MKMILKVAKGELLRRELCDFPGYFTEGHAEHASKTSNPLPVSTNWHRYYADKDGRSTETIWIVMDAEMYYKYSKPEVNAWGEIAP